MKWALKENSEPLMVYLKRHLSSKIFDNNPISENICNLSLFSTLLIQYLFIKKGKATSFIYRRPIYGLGDFPLLLGILVKLIL